MAGFCHLLYSLLNDEEKRSSLYGQNFFPLRLDLFREQAKLKGSVYLSSTGQIVPETNGPVPED